MVFEQEINRTWKNPPRSVKTQLALHRLSTNSCLAANCFRKNHFNARGITLRQNGRCVNGRRFKSEVNKHASVSFRKWTGKLFLMDCLGYMKFPLILKMTASLHSCTHVSFWVTLLKQFLFISKRLHKSNPISLFVRILFLRPWLNIPIFLPILGLKYSCNILINLWQFRLRMY